jgi:hypothetical protein
MKLTKAEAIVMLKELEEVVETAKSKVADKNGGFVADTPQFSGPCGDSFCYGSCDMAACHYSYRLGKTPEAHNRELAILVKQAGSEVQPMIKKLKALIKAK